jgi:hypothetical protein
MTERNNAQTDKPEAHKENLNVKLFRSSKSQKEKTGIVPSKQNVPSKSLERQFSFALNNHKYINDYIRFADQKAIFLFGITTAFLAFFFTHGLHKTCLKSIFAWTAVDVLYAAAILLLFISSIFSFWVMRPHLKSMKEKGFIYWETVIRHDTAAEYVESVCGLNDQSLLNEILDHHFRLSKVCQEKYHNLKLAIWLGGIAVLLSILVLIHSS